MAYVALYRKWRPASFADLVGQEHVSRTLTQAIETGRARVSFFRAARYGKNKYGENSGKGAELRARADS